MTPAKERKSTTDSVVFRINIGNSANGTNDLNDTFSYTPGKTMYLYEKP